MTWVVVSVDENHGYTCSCPLHVENEGNGVGGVEGPLNGLNQHKIKNHPVLAKNI